MKPTTLYRLLALLSVSALTVSTSAQITTIETSIEEISEPRNELPTELRGDIRALPIALMFTAMDTNRDKRVTRAEARTGIEADWQSLSPSITNKIGAFKIQDWAEQTLGSKDARPSRLSFDRNLDNQVSGDEFSERLLAAFDKLDSDKDGALSRAELVFISAPQIIREERVRRETRISQQPQRRR